MHHKNTSNKQQFTQFGFTDEQTMRQGCWFYAICTNETTFSRLTKLWFRFLPKRSNDNFHAQNIYADKYYFCNALCIASKWNFEPFRWINENLCHPRDGILWCIKTHSMWNTNVQIMALSFAMIVASVKSVKFLDHICQIKMTCISIVMQLIRLLRKWLSSKSRTWNNIGAVYWFRNSLKNRTHTEHCLTLKCIFDVLMKMRGVYRCKFHFGVC